MGGPQFRTPQELLIYLDAYIWFGEALVPASFAGIQWTKVRYVGGT